MDQYIGRIVAVLVGPIVVGASAWFATWAAENLPGAPAISASDLGEIGAAGALAAGLGIYQWLKNRGDHEVAEANRDAFPPE